MSAALATADQAAATPLWSHQRDGADRAEQRTSFLFAYGMGAGKSLTAIEVLERKQATSVLVVCPKSVAPVWPDELALHAAREWHVWSGKVRGARGKALASPSVPRRVVALIEAHQGARRLGRPFMAVVNYDVVHQRQMRALLEGTEWDVVILDESHRIKAPRGKASGAVASITARTRQRGGQILALTGTPMPHSALDLWAQMRALDGGRRLGRSYTEFCAAYGQPESIRVAGGQVRQVYKQIRPDKIGALRDAVSDAMHQVRAADVLDLPPTADVYRVGELGRDARRVYDSLEKDLIADLGTGVVTAANAMVNVLRLAQVTSGYAVDADTGEHVDLDTPGMKEQLLTELLGDLPEREPVVVFCRFRHDLAVTQRVTENLGRRYGELSGTRRDGMDGRRMDSSIDVLGCQLQSGGVGIDLTRAAHAVYYSADFKLADHDQSRARLHRPGQARRVVFTHLLADDTIDQAVYGALRKRREVVGGVLDFLDGRTP